MRIIKAATVVIICWALLQVPLRSSEDVLSLTLEECIIKTLKDNLRLAVEVFNPELADVSVTRAKEMFMPQLDLSFGRSREESPSYWWIQGEETVISKYADYGLSVVQQIPTGGNLSLSLTTYKSDTNQSFQLINPRYGSTLRFDFTQPLLRNFGFDISRREIIIARNNLDVSRSQLQTVLLDTVYRVQEAYWNLVFAIENHRVKRQSLELARDLLAKNRKEVEVGKLAPLEILNAETVVAQREADILQAEALIKRSEDQLKNILNLVNEGAVNPQRIVPLDQPTFTPMEVSLEAALAEAKQKRPDLQGVRTSLENKELGLRVAKNQMLPGLDLRFSYWSPGISGDRLRYLDDNPFLGVIVGREEGSRADSMRDALNLIYKNWTVGLTLILPLSTVLTRAEQARAKIEMEKGMLELKDKEQQVLLEVRDAVREVETNAKRVEAYRIARELAEKRLQAEEKKLAVGLTTNYFVLEFQEQLAAARSQEIKALIDYNLALAMLEKATGTGLENRNITLGR